MNKKLITLCVSALLAGGMVTPAFAALDPTYDAVRIDQPMNSLGELNIDGNQYYAIAMNNNNQTAVFGNWSLKATFEGYTLTDDAIDGYSLWRITEHKGGNGVIDGYQITNAYGIPLAIKATKSGGTTTYSLDKDGDITVLKYINIATDRWALGAKTADGTTLLIGQQGTTADTDNLVVVTNMDPSPRTSAVIFSLPSTALTATQLNSVFNGYFGLQIGRPDKDGKFDGYEDEGLQGNVFAGKLFTVDDDALKSSVLTYRLQSDETYLVNEAGEFIVLLKDKWDIVNTDLDPEAKALKGYRFATMTAKELAEDWAKGADATVKSYVFRIAGIQAHVKDVDAPLEVAVKVNMTASSWDEETWAELLVAGVQNESGEKSYYLTTAQAAQEEDDDADNDYLDLNVADYTSTTYVKFGMNNYVSPTVFWGAAWNIERQDNKTPNPQSGEWVDKREVGYTVPEGQWILREVNRVQAWVNRETGKNLNAADKFVFDGLRTTEEANVYVKDNGVKYKITKAVDLADWDRFNYFGYDAKETSTGVEETYKVMFNSQLTGEPIYISMDGVGELHLTNDPTKALEFHVDTIKTTDDAAVVNDLGLNANPDIFDIINKYMGKDEDGNWVEKEDTVSFYRYTLSHNGKYLHYDTDNDKYVLNEAVYNDGKGGLAGKADDQGKLHLVYTEDDLKDALNTTKVNEVKPYIVDAFVIKEKGGDMLNILNVNNDDYDNYFSYPGTTYDDIAIIEKIDGTNTVVGVNGSKFLSERADMMYFDFNFDEARQESNIYDWVANAQLQLDYQDYNIYRNVAPTAPDTMAIYRTEYQDEFLFEKNDFLGMTVDQRGYNAALFIDTAYVRNNTEKPLFMIGLRPEITPETVYCPLHGPNAGCAHEHLDTIPGYVDADYLTVLADSAAFHAAELKNEFLANSAYTKLAFIQARHNVDTITVADDNHKTTIVEGVQHPMVFAFRIVNQETKDFIIEGVDLKENKKEYHPVNNPYVTSWVRWNNGVPVMTDRMEDAEVFNIADDIESAPTANEAIEAEATVTVVATDGAVIVKGAEGKNVIVSTILGKVVANETVNSDNETIAAPAGIVVVSVDGESFKVAVK